MEPSANDNLKPLRKMRAISGFNAWHAEYLHSAESKALPTLAAKNKKSAELWRELSSEQQTVYKEKAAATNAGITGVNVKNECKKIIQSPSRFAVHNEKHLVGGTEIGRKFLCESGSHVPYSFLGYLSTTQTENSVSNLPPASSDHERSKEDHDSKDYLRRSVENLFNLCYGESIGDATAKLPYRKITEYGISVDGLPQDKPLKHPSSYGRLFLKQILCNKDKIRVKVSNHPNFQHQKQLATGSSNSSLMDNNVTVQDQGAAHTVPAAEVSVHTPKEAILKGHCHQKYASGFYYVNC